MNQVTDSHYLRIYYPAIFVFGAIFGWIFAWIFSPNHDLGIPKSFEIPKFNASGMPNVRVNIFSLIDSIETPLMVHMDDKLVAAAFVKKLFIDPPFELNDSTNDRVQPAPFSVEFTVDDLKNCKFLIITRPDDSTPDLIIPAKDVIASACEKIDVIIDSSREGPPWLCSIRCREGISYVWADSVSFVSLGMKSSPVGFFTREKD